MDKILVLGGYGNFGKRIVHALAAKNHHVIIAGRNRQKAQQLADEVGEKTSIAVFDINKALDENLKQLRPCVVINTCGPFQGCDYRVPEICISNGLHYIDLADARDFVTGISQLDQTAKKANVSVIAGASTVPGLSSAVVENFLPHFSKIDLLKYGISPGQQAERGLTTTRGILSYVGKPLKPFASISPQVFGWQNIYRQPFPELGKRWMANCEVPDLDLLPQKYGIKKIQFSAGLELTIIHLGLWALSGLVRLGLPLNLPSLASPLLAASNWFDRFGSADGGMHVVVKGLDQNNKPLEKKWFIIAKNGDGPQIPTIPAIILADRLAKGEKLPSGAGAAIGMVSLEDYLKELKSFAVATFEQ